MSLYDDIINMERPVSKKHKPMSMENRAAQFSPFAALTGYDEIIDETGRLTYDRISLSEDQRSDINNLLLYLNNNKNIAVNVTYFVKDEKKNGGHYENHIGNIKKIDLDKRIIVFENKYVIAIEDIVSLEI